MRAITLQTLTWGTVTAAVGSALWLAATEPGLDSRSAHRQPLIRPTDAGNAVAVRPQVVGLSTAGGRQR